MKRIKLAVYVGLLFNLACHFSSYATESSHLIKKENLFNLQREWKLSYISKQKLLFKRNSLSCSCSADPFLCPPGPSGLPGLQGPTGPTGAMGPTGATGAAGTGLEAAYGILYLQLPESLVLNPGETFVFTSAGPFVNTLPIALTAIQVSLAGDYLINYLVTLSNTQTSDGSIGISVNGQAPTPITIHYTDIPGIQSSRVIMGGIIQNLQAGDEISLVNVTTQSVNLYANSGYTTVSLMVRKVN